MNGNKMYVNGINQSLSWYYGGNDSSIAFQNYIYIGGPPSNNSWSLHGCESQIYYFDREL